MLIRSVSANGSRSSARTAPGGSRPKVLDRVSVGGSSATLLPSLGVTGSSFHKNKTSGNGGGAGLSQYKPPGLPLGSSSAFKSKPRLGNPNAKEDKNTAVISVDDLQRLR